MTQENNLPAERQEQVTLAAAGQSIRIMAETMQRMSETMQDVLDRMAELEAAVRTLEKVTPAQANQINAAMRERAREICEDWRIDGGRKIVTGWIRRAVTDRTGAKTAREIPRCDYGSVMGMIAGWEDVELIRDVRARMRREERA